MSETQRPARLGPALYPITFAAIVSTRARPARRNAHRFCVAPLMDCTDRHCRMLHRQLSRHALLYTEMVTANALIHGDVPRHLDFDTREQPVALQLGGSEPLDLAHAAALGERWGYAEINLNCGCPSERVQRGAFGACLMAEPDLVAACVAAMRSAVALPVTVKHRIGIDREEDYDFLRRFVERVAAAGAQTFIVHARNAWLKGLSPKENREIPPLRYDFVFRLKEEFPELEIVLNGGLVNFTQIEAALSQLDGVMLGREPYHNPYFLAEVDQRLFGAPGAPVTRKAAVERIARYAAEYLEAAAPGAQLRHIVRPLLGLYQGQPGARAWRRLLSDARELERNDVGLLYRALQEVEPRYADAVS